jgi:hypothetical protein
MSNIRTDQAAKLFHLLSEVGRILRLAHDNRQEWDSTVHATSGADGALDGGYEVHIVVKPPGK